MKLRQVLEKYIFQSESFLGVIDLLLCTNVLYVVVDLHFQKVANDLGDGLVAHFSGGK